MNKFLCLSFDDGPNVESGDTTMNDMLDILEEYNVPASFFLIGNKITEENKSVIQRAIKLGCDIENHSWTHPKMAELTKEEIEDIKKHMRRPTENIDPEFFEYTQDLSDKEKKKVAEYINYIKSIRNF